MKKAKQGRSKAQSSVNPLHISFVLDNKSRLDELIEATQSQAHGRIGSIRNLMAAHNALIDQMRGHSESNQNAIRRAASVIEAHVDQKIDSLNMFLESVNNEKTKSKSRRKTTKKDGRK